MRVLEVWYNREGEHPEARTRMIDGIFEANVPIAAELRELAEGQQRGDRTYIFQVGDEDRRGPEDFSNALYDSIDNLFDSYASGNNLTAVGSGDDRRTYEHGFLNPGDLVEIRVRILQTQNIIFSDSLDRFGNFRPDLTEGHRAWAETEIQRISQKTNNRFLLAANQNDFLNYMQDGLDDGSFNPVHVPGLETVYTTLLPNLKDNLNDSGLAQVADVYLGHWENWEQAVEDVTTAPDFQDEDWEQSLPEEGEVFEVQLRALNSLNSLTYLMDPETFRNTVLSDAELEDFVQTAILRANARPGSLQSITGQTNVPESVVDSELNGDRRFLSLGEGMAFSQTRDEQTAATVLVASRIANFLDPELATRIIDFDDFSISNDALSSLAMQISSNSDAYAANVSREDHVEQILTALDDVTFQNGDMTVEQLNNWLRAQGVAEPLLHPTYAEQDQEELHATGYVFYRQCLRGYLTNGASPDCLGSSVASQLDGRHDDYAEDMYQLALQNSGAGFTFTQLADMGLDLDRVRINGERLNSPEGFINLSFSPSHLLPGERIVDGELTFGTADLARDLQSMFGGGTGEDYDLEDLQRDFMYLAEAPYESLDEPATNTGGRIKNLAVDGFRMVLQSPAMPGRLAGIQTPEPTENPDAERDAARQFSYMLADIYGYDRADDLERMVNEDSAGTPSDAADSMPGAAQAASEKRSPTFPESTVARSKPSSFKALSWHRSKAS